jgi:hypothetical protein
MKSIQIDVLSILVCSFSTFAFAEGLSCIGMDGSGQAIHMLFDVSMLFLSILTYRQ